MLLVAPVTLVLPILAVRVVMVLAVAAVKVVAALAVRVVTVLNVPAVKVVAASAVRVVIVLEVPAFRTVVAAVFKLVVLISPVVERVLVPLPDVDIVFNPVAPPTVVVETNWLAPERSSVPTPTPVIPLRVYITRNIQRPISVAEVNHIQSVSSSPYIGNIKICGSNSTVHK